MRTIVLLALAPLLTQARVCGANEATAPVPIATASVTVGAAPVAMGIAKHGGQVITVDDVPVELIVKGDGEVVAYPVQGTAAQPAALTADAQVTVDVAVDSGGTRPVQLVWVPAEARFVGRVRGARVVTTQPSDVNVTVVSGGRRRHHRVERYVVAPGPTVVVAAPRPTVVVAAPPPGAVRVQGPAADVRVVGPSAQVRVQMPSVGIRIGGPAAVVRVEDDRRREHHDEGRHRGEDRDDHHDRGRHEGFGGGHGGGRRGRH